MNEKEGEKTVAEDVRRFLKWKKLTGDEVGRAMILDTVTDYRNYLEGNSDGGLFTQQELNRTESFDRQDHN